MGQNALVALIVACAGGYAAWSLAPRALKRRMMVRAWSWSQAAFRCPAWLRNRLARAVSSSATPGHACDACAGQSRTATANTDVTRKNPQ